MAVANNHGSVSVLLGNGDGTFKEAVNFPAGFNPNGVAVGDFNLDGKPDLAVANLGSHNVSILLGNGDGVFQSPMNFAIPGDPAPYYAVVGNFNLDGKPDLVTTSGTSSLLSVFLGNGDGTLKPAVNFEAGGGPGMLAVGDFNLDGKPDLATANASGTVSIFLGNGDGSFQVPLNFLVGGEAFSVAVGDFNLDGRPDLAVTNRSILLVLLGNGNGTFQPPVNFGTGGSNPFQVAVGDFNLDGKPDLAVVNASSSNNVSILINTCSPANQSPTVSVNSSFIATNEGSTANNTGAYSDPDSGDNVTITASVGTITKTGSNTGVWSWAFATTDGPIESQTVTITAGDGKGLIAATMFNLSVNNVAPSVSFSITANPIIENSSISLTGSIGDPGIRDSHSVVINWGDGSPATGQSLAAGVLSFIATHPYADDNPTGTASDVYPITVTVTDKDGATGGTSTPLTVNNAAPVISSVTGPVDPIALGGAATVTANFTDVGAQDTHTCTFAWDDGTTSSGSVSETAGSGSCTASRLYAAAGVYTVSIKVTDDDTGTSTKTFEFVVVYDPSAGFVTGGGWINSPAGAYATDPSLTGKANFGFVSKYERGASVPTGQTEFQFHVASFNFQSTVYEWLVVSGPKAQYKGSGTVNGTGNYGFLLTATDGQLPGGGGTDKFRIKIVNKATNVLVYDNVSGASEAIDAANPQVIAGGSIVIHN